MNIFYCELKKNNQFLDVSELLISGDMKAEQKNTKVFKKYTDIIPNYKPEVEKQVYSM